MTLTRTISTLATPTTLVNAADVTTPDNELLQHINDLINGVASAEQFRFDQIATPANPAASKNKAYFKSDSGLYRLDSSGSEILIGGLYNPGMVIHTPRTVVGADVSSVTISSIPTTFNHLLLIIEGRTDVAAANDNMLLRFNNDSTAADYYSQVQNNFGTTVATAETLGSGSTGIIIPGAVGATGSAGNGRSQVWILNYKSTTMRKLVLTQCFSHTGNTTGLLRLSIAGGDWTNTADAINRIDFLPATGSNIKQNSAYTLYGLN